MWEEEGGVSDPDSEEISACFELAVRMDHSLIVFGSCNFVEHEISKMDIFM